VLDAGTISRRCNTDTAKVFCPSVYTAERLWASKAQRCAKKERRSGVSRWVRSALSSRRKLRVPPLSVPHPYPYRTALDGVYRAPRLARAATQKEGSSTTYDLKQAQQQQRPPFPSRLALLSCHLSVAATLPQLRKSLLSHSRGRHRSRFHFPFQ
jgi:hypothetical protein